MSSRRKEREVSKTLIERLVERGEETVVQILSELVGRQGVAGHISKTIGQAADTKERVDRNVQFILSLLNLPSRADFARLHARLEGIQGGLVNLNMKIDRLIAAQKARPDAHATPDSERPARAERKGRRPPVVPEEE